MLIDKQAGKNGQKAKKGFDHIQNKRPTGKLGGHTKPKNTKPQGTVEGSQTTRQGGAGVGGRVCVQSGSDSVTRWSCCCCSGAALFIETGRKAEIQGRSTEERRTEKMALDTDSHHKVKRKEGDK
mmetsp:Transcript_41667/g.82236  ORF Transcript_41667/g.82236 Transcript_41667/m.82236 type:complete len:125 (+) Transcript_41667:353-727(+)